jgi:hypothetical protein
MNPIYPDEIPELVLLDRILKASNFTVTVYDLPQGQAKYQYGFDYSFNGLGAKGDLGRAFEQAAENLVPTSEGEIDPLRYNSGGFSALFPTDEKRLEFLKAFSDAALKLYTPPEPKGFVRTEDGYILGKKPYGM